MRDIGFVFLGSAVLVFKRHYSGPYEELFDSYAGNVAVAFALYFIALHVPASSRHMRLWAAGLALAAVELFEVFDGFGFMNNVYDTIDLAANAVGVSLALIVDTIWASLMVKGKGGFTQINHVVPDASKKKASN